MNAHQPDMFIVQRSPEEIIAEALSRNPRAIFVGFSGGNDSLAATHWMMSNVPGCEVVHINTGIGIERTRQHVRDTCAYFGWRLTEIHAKHDCGQDYREIVLKHGFPGPPMHMTMYSLLKERAVRTLVKRHKIHRRDKVMIATGIFHDESVVRMGYGENEINFVGSQMWVNPLYWWPKDRFAAYIDHHNIPRNPVSIELGMSGECLCGAFAHPGEKALVRLVCPATANYLDRLEIEVRAAGHDWGWEDRPPRKAGKRTNAFMPLCRNCEKIESPDMFAEVAA